MKSGEKVEWGGIWRKEWVYQLRWMKVENEFQCTFHVERDWLEVELNCRQMEQDFACMREGKWMLKHHSCDEEQGNNKPKEFDKRKTQMIVKKREQKFFY